VEGESTWTSGCKLDSGFLFSKALLKPSIYDEKNESGSTLKKKIIYNYSKIDVVNNNGENIDGTKI
jgi:hypothetical protein